MGTKRYIPKARHNDGKHLAAQTHLMRQHFPCFKCSLRHDVLECLGTITPCEECATYKIRIRLARGGTPKVKILDPPIAPSRKIHIYSDGNLCLYDYREQRWMDGDHIHEKIVPWIAEWLVYYELFLITGEWRGPEAIHDDGPKLEQKD